MNERTVMLIDDDVSFLKNLKDGLEYSIENIKLITHTNAEDAWKSLVENDISLIITDQKLPGMSGIELVNLVDKKYPAIPIILITAYGTPKLKDRARDIGAIKFFNKPIDLKNMIKEVEKGLDLAGNELTNIRKMSLATVLELISMEKLTSSVTVKDNETNESGRIWFKKGNIIDAEINNLEGIEAVFKMLSFGDVDTVIRGREHERSTIQDVSLEYILLEGMKRLDEKNNEEQEKVVEGKKNKETINTEKEKFDKAFKLLKKELGETLLASHIFTIQDSKKLSCYNSTPKTGEYFNKMTTDMDKYLEKIKLPLTGKYYLIDLKGNKTLIILTFKKYRWALLLDSRKLKLGLLLNLILPDIIETL
jgi:FixJ family two-component response regulator